jgi:hypothetical protein
MLHCCRGAGMRASARFSLNLELLYIENNKTNAGYGCLLSAA